MTPLILVARLFYWISGFAILGAGIALVLHLVPAVYSEGDGKHGTVNPSWELVLILGVIAVGTWVIAQVLAYIAARQLERL
jgi:hypothetical protein